MELLIRMLEVLGALAYLGIGYLFFRQLLFLGDLMSTRRWLIWLPALVAGAIWPATYVAGVALCFLFELIESISGARDWDLLGLLVCPLFWPIALIAPIA